MIYAVDPSGVQVGPQSRSFNARKRLRLFNFLLDVSC